MSNILYRMLKLTVALAIVISSILFKKYIWAQTPCNPMAITSSCKEEANTGNNNKNLLADIIEYLGSNDLLNPEKPIRYFHKYIIEESIAHETEIYGDYLRYSGDGIEIIINKRSDTSTSSIFFDNFDACIMPIDIKDKIPNIKYTESRIINTNASNVFSEPRFHEYTFQKLNSNFSLVFEFNECLRWIKESQSK